MTLQDKIKLQYNIINEMEIYFRFETAWLSDRDDMSKLDKFKMQGRKVRQMIAESKKPTPTLRDE